MPPVSAGVTFREFCLQLRDFLLSSHGPRRPTTLVQAERACANKRGLAPQLAQNRNVLLKQSSAPARSVSILKSWTGADGLTTGRENRRRCGGAVTAIAFYANPKTAETEHRFCLRKPARFSAWRFAQTRAKVRPRARMAEELCTKLVERRHRRSPP